MTERHYPERSAQIFIINAPSLFPAVYRVVRPWLDPVTASKVHIFRHGYEATLREFIDPASLPVCYGGECQCAPLDEGTLADVAPGEDQPAETARDRASNSAPPPRGMAPPGARTHPAGTPPQSATAPSKAKKSAAGPEANPCAAYSPQELEMRAFVHRVNREWEQGIRTPGNVTGTAPRS